MYTEEGEEQFTLGFPMSTNKSKLNWRPLTQKLARAPASQLPFVIAAPSVNVTHTQNCPLGLLDRREPRMRLLRSFEAAACKLPNPHESHLNADLLVAFAWRRCSGLALRSQTPLTCIEMCTY